MQRKRCITKSVNEARWRTNDQTYSFIYISVYRKHRITMVITFNAPKLLFPVPSWLVSSTPHLRLLNTVRLDRLGVGHLSVLLFCLRGLALCLGLGLALLALNLGLLLGVLLLVLLYDRLALALGLGRRMARDIARTWWCSSVETLIYLHCS